MILDAITKIWQHHICDKAASGNVRSRLEYIEKTPIRAESKVAGDLVACVISGSLSGI